MPLFQTITTIELSTRCDLACKYCINRLMETAGRKRIIMDDRVFMASIDLLSDLCLRGTQHEVNLNGNGESCLDIQLPARVRIVCDIMGARPVSFSTNGVSMTRELAKALRDAGLKEISLSPHSPYHARTAAIYLLEAGINVTINLGPIASSHNWAGQLEPEHCVPYVRPLRCDPIIEGRGYIQAEGDITPCCYDYRGMGSFGTVFDDDIFDREPKPFDLCKTCHQVIPQDLRLEAVAC